MQFKDISVPEIYKESSDFRFFMDWFAHSLTKLKYDTENAIDCYDSLRCKSDLLWLLGDTIGYKYDDRLPIAFNRLVILYFMSMIRNKGSKDGVTLAAEINLAQFRVNMIAGEGYTDDSGNTVEPNPILYERLEDTSIPVNSVYVTPHVEEGYIDVVYFSSKKPIDACIEYVRPLGMYCFQHAGVRVDSRTKVSIDARLTNENDIGVSIGPTHIGHYRRDDYARLQHTTTQKLLENGNMSGYSIRPKYEYDIMKDSEGNVVKDSAGNPKINVKRTYYQIINANNKVIQDNIDTKAEAAAMLPNYMQNDSKDYRQLIWQRNKDVEEVSHEINPGYRALYSLQLANNEQIVKSLIDPIFSLGYGPQDVDVTYSDDYIKDRYKDKYANRPGVENKPWNLRYDKQQDESIGPDVYTVDSDRTKDIMNPRPAVSPVMMKLGDAISMDPGNPINKKYTKVDDEGNINIEDIDI